MNIPNGPLYLVCEYLKIKDILSLSESCKSLHERIFRNSNMKNLFEQRLHICLGPLLDGLKELRKSDYSKFLWGYKKVPHLISDCREQVKMTRVAILRLYDKKSDGNFMQKGYNKVTYSFKASQEEKKLNRKLIENRKLLNLFLSDGEKIALQHIKHILLHSKPLKIHKAHKITTCKVLSHLAIEDWQKLFEVYQQYTGFIHFSVFGFSKKKPLALACATFTKISKNQIHVRKGHFKTHIETLRKIIIYSMGLGANFEKGCLPKKYDEEVFRNWLPIVSNEWSKMPKEDLVIFLKSSPRNFLEEMIERLRKEDPAALSLLKEKCEEDYNQETVRSLFVRENYG